MTFNSYELAVSPLDRDKWEVIQNSSNPIKNGILGTWQTGELPRGFYRLRLTLRVNGNTGNYPTHDFPAGKVIRLGIYPAGAMHILLF